MNTHYFIGFNNYSNRRVIYYKDLLNYINHSINDFQYTSIDFNPNDGVNTSQVVNWEGTAEETPDYMLVLNNDGSIKSRWFVMEWERLRGGQYRATLRRDVVADHFQNLNTTKLFAERGPIVDPKDKLIFNSEGMSLNQIKTSQEELTDETGKAWIVGYINRDYEGGEVTSIPELNEAPTDISELGIKLIGEDISNGGYVETLTGTTSHPNIWAGVEVCKAEGFLLSTSYHNLEAQVDGQTMQDKTVWERTVGDFEFWTAAYECGSHSAFQNLFNLFRSKVTEYGRNTLGAILKADLETTMEPNLATAEQYSKFRNARNSIVSYNGKTYRMNVSPEIGTDEIKAVSNNYCPNSYNALKEVITGVSNNLPEGVVIRGRGNYTNISYRKLRYNITFYEVDNPAVVKTTIKNTGERINLRDAPYDMFCMEYNENNLSLAQAIVKSATQNNIFDIQILPYCPARFAIDDIISGYPASTSLDVKTYSNILKGTDALAGRLYYCNMSSDSFTINKTISIPFRSENPVLNIKLSNECDVYRLSSPNMSSSFEFSVAKNGGVNSFVVTYTYRPISPYVRVQPEFANMYGTNYKDGRGLILSGDYSIDMLSDAWKQYEVNNKNYQNIFNTQIKSMEYQHQQDRISAITGLATGTAKGAVGGMITGNVVGAAIGAAAGLTTGITNLATGENKYKEQLQTKIDLYNYELGNIKAQPDTLTKISAYNIDNNYFPVLEYYTCTKEELDIVTKKIEYQSYKLMKTCNIGDLTVSGEGLTFVKGQIIRLEGVTDDDHLANEIYNEFYKGVYL